jgi:transposase
MKRFIESAARDQVALLPECLDYYVDADNAVRMVDVFVDDLDLVRLGFERAMPVLVGRPAYHPSTLLKLYIYGYLNRIQSSRRPEQEARRNLELIWLTRKLVPDFKTIAGFRKDNGVATRKVCREFVLLCRRLKVFSDATVLSTAAKLRRSTTVTRISLIASFRLAWSNLNKALLAIWMNWTGPIESRRACRLNASLI